MREPDLNVNSNSKSCGIVPATFCLRKITEELYIWVDVFY